MADTDILLICEAATARIAAGDPVEAAELLAGPLALAGRNPNLLYMAGNCALAQGDRAAARAYYERAVASAPTFGAALTNLGFVLRSEQHLAEARAVLRRAVTLDPTNEAAWVNLVSCSVNEGEAAAGEALAREAIAVHPEHAVMRWNLALLLLEQGKWREGWQEYRHRFDTPAVRRRPGVRGLRRLLHPAQIAAGETVLCHGEQGLGDEILFAGVLGDFIAEVGSRGAEVILSPNPRLAGVFERSFPASGPRETLPANAVREPLAPDWCIPIGDLPGFYRNCDEAFPFHSGYLSVDPDVVAGIRTTLAVGPPQRPLVGIAWRGGIVATHAVHRSIPLEDWLPILRQDATFVSLAYHEDSTEIESLRQRFGAHVISRPKITSAQDYARTCELVAALDLVITVPTSVHHVAGAVGTPCWLVMDERAAWRECSRHESIPWYPRTHRRFVRSRTMQGWHDILSTIARALADWSGPSRPPKRSPESG